MYPASVCRYWKRQTVIGLIAFCLPILAACSAQKPVSQVTIVAPPDSLMQETQHPDWTPRTNKELAKWAIETDKALSQCNADKTAMRTYVQNVRRQAQENASR